MRLCDSCGEKKEDHEFNSSNDICIYCEAEKEAVGEPITKDNLGEIMLKQFNKKEVQNGSRNSD